MVSKPKKGSLTKAQQKALVDKAIKQVFSGSNLVVVKKYKKWFVLDHVFYSRNKQNNSIRHRYFSHLRDISRATMEASPQFNKLSKGNKKSLTERLPIVLSQEFHKIKFIIR